MTRISLTEQYDNKDVIQQIYTLKDTVDDSNDIAERAEAKADEAIGSVQSAVDAANTATAKATEATNAATEATRISTEASATANEVKEQMDAFQEEKQTFVTSGRFAATEEAGTMDLIHNPKPNTEIVLKTLEMPIANAQYTGLMNATTYRNVESLGDRVTALEKKTTTYYVTLPSVDPSQSELTTAFKSASGRDPLPGDYLVDVEKALTFGYTGTVWVQVGETITVQPFTNTTLGIIKGSQVAGKVFAETDGTGSVYGWDLHVAELETAKSDISANTEAITANTSAIATLKGRVDGHDTSITALQTKDTELENSISSGDSALSGRIDTLDSTIGTMQTSVATNATDISNLKTDKQATLTGTAVTLAQSLWNTSTKQQTVSVSGMTASANVWVSADGASWDMYGNSGVRCVAQATGTLTFQCTEIPSADVTANIIFG